MILTLTKNLGSGPEIFKLETIQSDSIFLLAWVYIMNDFYRDKDLGIVRKETQAAQIAFDHPYKQVDILKVTLQVRKML